MTKLDPHLCRYLRCRATKLMYYPRLKRRRETRQIGEVLYSIGGEDLMHDFIEREGQSWLIKEWSDVEGFCDE